MYKTEVSGPNHFCKNQSKKLKILIVDDDDDARESLKDMIVSRGHDVTTLDEGMKCVNRCSNNTYDIIFMDYHINDLMLEDKESNVDHNIDSDADPDTNSIDGTDIIKMIRECFNIESIIYAYTGDNSKKAITDFKNNNVKGALIKPVDPYLINDFFSIIEKNIDDKHNLTKLAIKKKNFMYFQK